MSKYNRRLLRLSVQEQLRKIEQEVLETMVMTPSGEYKPRLTNFIVNIGDKRSVVDLSSVDAYNKSIDQLPDEAFHGLSSRDEVFEAINKEREHQDKKYGANRPQSLAGFLLIIENELAEAKKGWMKDSPGRDAPLNEIVQVAAVCVAALERYGVTGNTYSTDDIPDPQDPVAVKRNGDYAGPL